MTLKQLLETLTTDVTVTVKDLATGDLIAEMRAKGFASLEDAIEARTVAQWSVQAVSHIEVLLNAAA